MNLVICHVDKGGAYRVAKFYAETLDAELLVKPSLLDLAKAFFRKPSTVIFHAPHQCAKVLLILRLISPKSRAWCVEHFYLPQILRYEFKSKFKRLLWLWGIKLNQFLGVKPICIDKISAKARIRLLGKSEIKVVGNVIPGQIPPFVGEKPYDWVWAGGLNPQKRWPQVLDMLIEAKQRQPRLRILVCSYNRPSYKELDKLKLNGIHFSFNEPRWTEKADRFFFSSIYEGFPLALGEAMAAGMGIFAWCQRSCRSQLLRYYSGSNWISCNSKIDLIDEFYATPRSGAMYLSALQEHEFRSVQSSIRELL